MPWRPCFSNPGTFFQATEAAMLLDLRQHPVDNLLNKSLEAFHGPAIVFWNNQQFTEKDFANLCKFGGETKLEDRTKVGKFGLGFNSVYNITDLPSFVSGHHLCMLDPHECYLGDRGRKWNLTAQTEGMLSVCVISLPHITLK